MLFWHFLIDSRSSLYIQDINTLPDIMWDISLTHVFFCYTVSNFYSQRYPTFSLCILCCVSGGFLQGICVGPPLFPSISIDLQLALYLEFVFVGVWGWNLTLSTNHESVLLHHHFLLLTDLKCHLVTYRIPTSVLGFNSVLPELLHWGTLQLSTPVPAHTILVTTDLEYILMSEYYD